MHEVLLVVKNLSLGEVIVGTARKYNSVSKGLLSWTLIVIHKSLTITSASKFGQSPKWDSVKIV